MRSLFCQTMWCDRGELDKDQRAGGARLYAGGDIPAGTMIALHRPMEAFVPHDRPEGTDHNA